MQEVFDNIWKNNGWKDAESASGPGSTMDATRNVRYYLAQLFDQLSVETFLDVPCGDFHWIKELRPILPNYIGGDIVPGIIEQNKQLYGTNRIKFKVMDLTNDPLPAADLVLVRDLFVHLRDEEIVRAIRNIKASGSKWLLATTFPGYDDQRLGMVTGTWCPTNLEKWQYGLGEPVAILPEGLDAPFQNKSLGLWRLD